MSPYYLPFEATALAIAHSIGPDGVLYSSDPKGAEDDPYGYNISYGYRINGGSAYLGEQLGELRNHGVPLGKFEWLGSESRFDYIPDPARGLDGIADHNNIEFLYRFTSREYIINGILAQLSTIRPGGLYVHQSSHELDIMNIFNMPFETWLTTQGYHAIVHTLQDDEVKIPISNTTEMWMDSIGENAVRSSVWLVAKENLGGNALLFNSRYCTSYPSMRVYVVQKPS